MNTIKFFKKFPSLETERSRSFGGGRGGLIILFIFHYSLLNAQSWPPNGMLGNGTSGSPWEIADSAHLKALADFVNASTANSNATAGKYYRLMNDIDLSGYANWTPIGGVLISLYEQSCFYGNFYGNSKVVHNLTINRPSENYVGLFGLVWDGYIENLGIVNCNITGKEFVGGIAGASNYLTNCFVVGNITDNSAYSATGGLLGYGGSVTNCYFIGNVTGYGSSGGLLGGASYSTILNCFAIGSVQGGQGVGGLIGTMTGGMPEEGSVSCIISNCYATNNVQGEDFVGGLVGFTSYDYSVVIRNCIASNDTVIGTGPINSFHGGASRNSFVNRILGYSSGSTVLVAQL